MLLMNTLFGIFIINLLQINSCVILLIFVHFRDFKNRKNKKEYISCWCSDTNGNGEIASKNSSVVCSVFVDGKMIGFGRAISDGQYQSAIYDVVVLPEFQDQGVGKTIMNALLKKLPKTSTILIFAAPGKEHFYRKYGFCNLKTGMGLFSNAEWFRANGYIE